ncbi:hypothetical protein [Mesomycoplasma lagogenitalium]|uniref:Uncharacterized protein n=1 Tax=Mesomycoplasma lagogenitalium TaxID=171286 RepID=A0ABY8LTP1_9BACT|nr:hypothetical protein [Mesomycoplasma lagogenitalium]WGI36599.1 hypothetical protein QEG99_04005 [Mesomycoplasma lagogenitalium]
MSTITAVGKLISILIIMHKKIDNKENEENKNNKQIKNLIFNDILHSPSVEKMKNDFFKATAVLATLALIPSNFTVVGTLIGISIYEYRSLKDTLKKVENATRILMNIQNQSHEHALLFLQLQKYWRAF